MLRWQRVAVRPVQRHTLTKSRSTTSRSLVAQMGVRSVSRDKCLSLRRHWRKHALLVEANAVAAAPILGGIEAGASDLHILVDIRHVYFSIMVITYLAPTAVSASNGSALSRGSSLVDDGRSRRRRRVYLRRTLIRTVRRGRKTVGVLGRRVLHVWLNCGHIWMVRSVRRWRRILIRQLGGMHLHRDNGQSDSRCAKVI